MKVEHENGTLVSAHAKCVSNKECTWQEVANPLTLNMKALKRNIAQHVLETGHAVRLTRTTEMEYRTKVIKCGNV